MENFRIKMELMSCCFTVLDCGEYFNAKEGELMDCIGRIMRCIELSEFVEGLLRVYISMNSLVN